MRHPFCIATTLALLGGCTGVIADPSAEGSGGAAGESSAPRRDRELPADVCTPEVRPGDAPFRRLGRDEYRRTLADLLRIEVAPPEGLPEDDTINGFPVGTTVTPLHVEVYFETAEELAAAADLGRLAPCVAAGETDRACAEAFVSDVGLRAYRRPLEPAERDRLLAVFDVAEEFERGLRMVLEVLLQSPKLVYQIERGASGAAPGDVVPLSGWERASRLSYFLWGSMPDDALFDAAAAGELDDAEGVAAQARRMLDDPRAREWVRRFHRSWLELELDHVAKDAELFPEWSPELSDELVRQLDEFVDEAFWRGPGSFEALLASPDLGLEELSDVYGDASERAGILTHPAFLARHANPERTSPVQRGARIRELVLCLPVPPPPEGVDTTLPPSIEGVTERERLEAHRADPTCAGCHSLIDPIGLALERFDAIGRYRTHDMGEPIDATGALLGTPSSDGEVDGARELAELLAGSDDVRSCLSAKWLQYAIGRPPTDEDACAIEMGREALARSGGDLVELVVEITRSDAFLYRRVTEGEVTP